MKEEEEEKKRLCNWAWPEGDMWEAEPGAGTRGWQADWQAGNWWRPRRPRKREEEEDWDQQPAAAWQWQGGIWWEARGWRDEEEEKGDHKRNDAANWRHGWGGPERQEEEEEEEEQQPAAAWQWQGGNWWEPCQWGDEEEKNDDTESEKGWGPYEWSRRFSW